ncbi:MAG: glycoside hydrolase family 31 protein, partial [Propionibacteriaceae bacterium]|nr:glycoside hydrolase family 31 protein [Propionibacteriaceae bacterium]
MRLRSPWKFLAASLAIPALVATCITTLPAQAVDVGDNRHGTTAISPKSVGPEVAVDDSGITLGAVTAVTGDGNVVTLTAERGAYRITFLDADTFRIEASRGQFTDPANSPSGDPERAANIVVGAGTFPQVAPAVTDGATIKLAAAGGVSIEIDKATGSMTAKSADGAVLFSEKSATTFGGTSTTQHLAVKADEQFLGGGMQNGRSIHTGATINIARNFDWDDDGYPNAVPYYMTSAGYGVLRNTFARGTYDFAKGTTTHEENRFDAYYFAGDYKGALDSYTQLTGRPMMPPVYALEYGDADCYNRSSPTYTAFRDPEKLTTLQAVDFAQDFVDNDMPAGWMLVNDGYGCEYQDLPETVQKIKAETGMETGLWTQRSLTAQPYEVGTAGVRMRKLDVAWVGQGYRMALTGCEAAYNGFEDNSDARGTSLMVEGWAGSQRCGMQWTGDHSGDLDAVRWQVSALTGSGNSGLPFTTGDVDGIFGGSTESYVRDLQWKAFAPALYSMSGWAGTDKRPWLYGEEATEINRDYLQLRQQLMPYIYSLSQNAHATGTPVMRSLAMEYPDDLGAYSVEANNEFLLGTDYLVAPVYTKTEVRDGIYLPAGDKWVDWWTGRVHDGGQVLNGHPAPLDKLPIFVRAGAVVPHGIIARNASLVPEDSELTVAVHPLGTSTYSLYEDDKTTRAYREGVHSTQELKVTAPESGPGDVTVTIGKREGAYDGKSASRPYRVVAHTNSAPTSVTVGGAAVSKAADVAALEAATTGWLYEAATGTVTVKTGEIASSASTVVVLKDSSAVGGKDPDAMAAQTSVALPSRVFRGADTEVMATFVNTGTKTKTDVAFTLELPEGWTVASSGTAPGSVAAGATASQTFVVKAGSSATAGQAVVKARANYTDSTGSGQSIVGAATTELTYGSLADAFNLVSITTVAGAAKGNFDGSGNSFSAAALEAVGAKAGEKVTIGTGEAAITYDWPAAADVPNSVVPNGQTIALSGQGSHLAVLASSSTGQGANAPITVNYTDGTTGKGSIGVPNWLPQGANDATVAFRSMGRNSKDNGYEYATYGYQIYQAKMIINPGKTVQSITLGNNSQLKIFAWALVEQDLPTPPSADVFASDLAWLSSSNGYGSIGLDVANLDPGQTQAQGKPLKSNHTDAGTGTKKVFEKGLGVHANGTITYYLGGQCSAFTAEVGQEDGFNGPVIFTVNGDGKDLYKSRTFVPDFQTEKINVNLSGVDFLELSINHTGSAAGAHGIWGDAKFMCSELTTEPTVTATASATATATATVEPSVTATATVQ